MHRRRLLAAMLALGAAPVARAADHGLSDSQFQDGRDLLARGPSVDLHSHAGRFFVEAGDGATPLGLQLGKPFEALGQARAARLGAVCLAAVADYRVLEAAPTGLRATGPMPAGQALADYRRQLDLLKATAKAGGLDIALSAADVRRNWRAGRTSAILTVEGGDFIEDKLERIGQAHEQGIRAVTLIHYLTNAFGDPQTVAPVHGGLSRLGRAAVAEMNRRGIVVDLSHASFDAVVQAAEVSTRPMILSHSNLKPPGVEHPRLVSLGHAGIVARHGGVVAAMPGGAGVASLADFATLVLRMMDQLGADHVAVGTDMDFTFASVTPTYADWGLIPAALLARGLSPDETLKLMGGNALRVFAANQPRR